MNILQSVSPFWLAVIASLFTWSVTALGALLVFFFKVINRKILDLMLGFSAGVMIAASFWSLIAPAIDLARELGYIEWILPAIGFLLGGLFIVFTSKLLDKTLSFKAMPGEKAVSYKRSIMLVSSVTLHNIPEGLAVGVAFGGVALCIPGCTIVGALMLALGIGIQNFPEGAAVALPLRREGMSRLKAFFIGQASGVVEPIAAILGFFLTIAVRSILPLLLTFSAGAMIAVVTGELVPEGTKENKNLTVIGCIFGFLVMMILDVALNF